MGFPFRTIVTSVDFDDDLSLAALDLVRDIAKQHAARVVLVNAVTLPVTAEPALIEVFEGQEREARKRLAALAKERLPGIEWEVAVAIGSSAAQIILRVARQVGADLIVMATHGRRGLSRMLLGSVTEMVLRETPCPVLCVRPEASSQQKTGSEPKAAA